MRYQFTNACLIGVEEIDNEHRELFRLIEEAHNLLENELIEDKYDHIQSIIAQLNHYAATHFKHEEEYMEKIRHPELEYQKRQHAFFTHRMDELNITGMSENQEKTLDELLVFLLKWLYRHIIACDSMIGKLEPKEENNLKVKYTGVFTDEFKTGISLVDEEHKELFRIIDEVGNLIKDEFIPDKYDEIVRLLRELKDYAIYHFKDEEDYMERIHYQGLPAQKKAHIVYIDHLAEIDLEDIDANQQESLNELLEFLTQWLLNHILKMDKKIPVVQE